MTYLLLLQMTNNGHFCPNWRKKPCVFVSVGAYNAVHFSVLFTHLLCDILTSPNKKRRKRSLDLSQKAKIVFASNLNLVYKDPKRKARPSNTGINYYTHYDQARKKANLASSLQSGKIRVTQCGSQKAFFRHQLAEINGEDLVSFLREFFFLAKLPPFYEVTDPVFCC